MMAADSGSCSFPHDKGDLVLVKWNDGMVYFAKIKRIDYRRQKCVVIFDDRSTDEAAFSQIHNVDETTTDIICIKCKKDDSETPNEIVLCDLCGIGFHQKCHNPPIPATALELNSPWHCIFCVRHVKNPYLTESIDVMQSLFEEDDDEEERLAPKSQQNPVRVKIEKDTDTSSTSNYYVPPPLLQKSPPAPKRKKVGRPRLSESNKRGKMRPLEVLRRKLAKTTSGRAAAASVVNRNHRKRSLGQDVEYPFGATSPKMSCGTVESHTVSVQQVSSSEPLSTASSALNSADDEGADSESSLSTVPEQPFVVAKKPRSLRVSLTLPPSVETSPVSSTTQKSPPDMLPWKQPIPETIEPNESRQEIESSPEPSLQIKMEDECSSNNPVIVEESSPVVVTAVEQNTHTNASTDDESALYIDLDHSSTFDDSSNGPPPLNASSDASEQYVDTATKIDSSTQTLLEAKESPQPANRCDTVTTTTSDSTKSDHEVIIIEDNSPQKLNKKTSVSSPTKSSCRENTSHKIMTGSNTTSGLVKVVPGVTSLMPRRASVIQTTPVTPPYPSVSTPSPSVSTPSPLEQLQMQVKQANMASMLNRAAQTRRNSCQSSPTVPPVQRTNISRTLNPTVATITSPVDQSPSTSTVRKGTTPLSHIDEPCSEHHRSVKHKYPEVSSTFHKVTSSLSSTPVHYSNATTSVPITTVSKETIDNIAFSQEVISATRTRKPPAPSTHYTTNDTVRRPSSQPHQAERSSHHQRKPSSSTRILQHPLSSATSTGNNNYITATAHSTSTSGNIITSATVNKLQMAPANRISSAPIQMAPANMITSVPISTVQMAPASRISSAPIGNVPANMSAPVGSMQMAPANIISNAPAGSQAVVVTPTTITATGEVATVYTLVHPEQAEITNPAVQYPSPQINEVSYRPVVLTQQAVPAQMNPVPAVVAVQAPDTTGTAQQSVVPAGPYYTIMEVNDSTERHTNTQIVNQHSSIHSVGIGGTPTINTTKPYAVVNAIPTNQPSPPLRSPPASLNIAPPSINKRKRTAPMTLSSPPPYSTAIQQQQQQKQRTSPHSLQKQPTVQTDKGTVTASMQQNKIINKELIEHNELVKQLHHLKTKCKKDFDSVSEENLLELFQSAVKQFRENGRKYEALIGKRLPPPNVEVIDDGGTLIVQQNTSRIIKPKARRLVSHVSPAALRRVSPPSGSSTTGLTNQVSSIPHSTDHHHPLTASTTSTQQQQKVVYQTSGVFVPPSEEITSTVPSSSFQTMRKPTTPVTAKPQQQILYNQMKRLLPPQLHSQQQQQRGQPITSSQQPSRQHMQQQQYSTQQSQQQYSTQQQKLSHSPAQQQYTVINSNSSQAGQTLIRSARNYRVATDTSSSPASSSPVVIRRPAPVTSNITTTMIPPQAQYLETTAGPLVPPNQRLQPSQPVSSGNDVAAARKRDRVCAPCGKNATFLCSGCHSEWYCSRECQLNAWDQHANYCKTLKQQQ